MGYLSEYLGLHTTTGTYKKTKHLQDLVEDPLKLQFLMDAGLPGMGALTSHLLQFQITLSEDGTLTIAKTDRYQLCDDIGSTTFFRFDENTHITFFSFYVQCSIVL